MIAAIYAALILMLMVAVPRDSEAEGAWVLWVEEQFTSWSKGGTELTWTVIQATDAHGDCEKALAGKIKEVSRPEPLVETKVKGNMVFSDHYFLHYETKAKTLDRTHTRRYLCLPDTVDPRGPKGK